MGGGGSVGSRYGIPYVKAVSHLSPYHPNWRIIMIIKSEPHTKTITIATLTDGEVFTYVGITYIRGRRVTAGVTNGRVNCTRLKDGSRRELGGSHEVIHHPTATLTLNP